MDGHDPFCYEQLQQGHLYGLLLLWAFWSCMFCWFAEKLIFSDLLFVYRSAEGA